jgi:hypothetical protein
MKGFDLFKVLRICVVVFSLVILPIATSAFSQTGDDPSRPMGDNPRLHDDQRDWGWLGLLGLAGLAGIARRRQGEPLHHREPGIGRT